jgi:biopolymer transport protein TolQ
LRYQKKKLHQLTDQLQGIRTFEELLQMSKEFEQSVGGRFLVRNLKDLKMLLENNESVGKLASSSKVQSRMTLHDLEYLEVMLHQSLDQIVLEEESYLPILSTSAHVSPLIGLFGTVWGLVHAFISISQEKTADITVVAPGIAEALITTLAGLIVAIPAIIFFHYFSNDLRKIEQRLLAVSDRFFAIVKQTFVR